MTGSAAYAEELFAAAERKWAAPAGVFVACAGRGLPGTLLGSNAARWEALVKTGLLALVRQMRPAAAGFVRQAEGDGGCRARDIVVIGSTADREVSAADPVYGATEAAVPSLTEALRQEVCAHDVRVTLIEPGSVRSGFQETAGYDTSWLEEVAGQGGPLFMSEDVAPVIAFAVSWPIRVHLDGIRVRPTRQKP